MYNFKFLTKDEFNKLPSDSIVWNRKGVRSKLFNPENLWIEGLNHLEGKLEVFEWSDDQFVEIPKEFTKRVFREYFDRVGEVIVWKTDMKTCEYKKQLELFCKNQGLYF